MIQYKAIMEDIELTATATGDGNYQVVAVSAEGSATATMNSQEVCALFFATHDEFTQHEKITDVFQLAQEAQAKLGDIQVIP